MEGIPVLLYFMCKGKDEDGVTDIQRYIILVYITLTLVEILIIIYYTGGIVDQQEKVSDFMRVFYNNMKE